MNKTRTTFSPEFKAQVVLQLMREENTVNELSSMHQISPFVIGRWKTQFLERAFEVFKKGPSDAEQSLVEKEEQIAELERKVSQLTIGVDLDEKKTRELRSR